MLWKWSILDRRLVEKQAKSKVKLWKTKEILFKTFKTNWNKRLRQSAPRKQNIKTLGWLETFAEGIAQTFTSSNCKQINQKSELLMFYETIWTCGSPAAAVYFLFFLFYLFWGGGYGDHKNAVGSGTMLTISWTVVWADVRQAGANYKSINTNRHICVVWAPVNLFCTCSLCSEVFSLISECFLSGLGLSICTSFVLSKV